MSCLSAEQLQKIEENKRLALQRRINGLNGTPVNPILPNLPPSKPPNASNFYQQPIASGSGHGQARPFPLSTKNAVTVPGPIKTETASFQLISEERFCVEMAYHEPSIQIMRNAKGRLFDAKTRNWTFPITEHDNLLAALKPHVVVAPLPKAIINTFKVPPVDINHSNLSKIDETMREMLMPFQKEGVRFGISRRGRCLIADDMGLGKTVQALAIAHYYVEAWPLLIVCPSSMKFPWEEAIHRFLPSVNPFTVVVMTKSRDDFHDAKVVITSYDLLKSCLGPFKQKNFGVIVFDESHFLKTRDSARTKAALQLSPKASHVILLSGTPALSRPLELFPQIRAIDPSCFPTLNEFGMRYCNGKRWQYGWNFTGSSNSGELELFLKRKFMIRRLKGDVLKQLPSKVRTVVYLRTQVAKGLSNHMGALEATMEKQSGLIRRGTLLAYYSETGTAKLPAVTEYISDKLESPGKMLIFAHHKAVLDGLADMVINKGIDYIRIDGSTPSQKRAALCEQFQTDPETRVAVLSLKAANSGITLTAAHLVIFAELYWNPGELTQAEDRAHRIGQQDCVLVEYLLAKGTADDHLWPLVESKLKVLNSVGLSKESFKNAHTEELTDPLQATIPDMLGKAEASSNSEAKDQQKVTELSDSQQTVLLDLDLNAFDEPFTEDDIFDSVDLASIEDEYCSETKRPKLDT